jgi:signal transduction histidine kinase
MTKSHPGWKHRYRMALRSHIAGDGTTGLAAARVLGIDGASMPVAMLSLVHEQTLTERPEGTAPATRRRRAAAFFSAMLCPTRPESQKATAMRHRFEVAIAVFSRCSDHLADQHAKATAEILRLRDAEAALTDSERRNADSLRQSDILQDQLRRLSRQVLSAQEDERKQISRELHDVIAQTLTGITLRLATLKRQAELDTKTLDRNIARTQRLVGESVEIVRRFARELRPAALDDLGLVPALQSYANRLGRRSNLHISIAADATVERLDMARRTVLFRIAVEALTNVSRHAHATTATIVISAIADGFRMEIHDDGRSFQVDRVLSKRGSGRLGLIGMRERIEMVGGRFEIVSAPGSGTTVGVTIPIGTRA